jgi:adenosylcobyric acid synthase
MSSRRTRLASCVMVCGTTSGAGKSLLTTALARFYSNRGLKVAPFKAQNMSNNARVVEGGEIASAQYLQALAARCVPEVRMNPVLLKPETDTRSQVILLGRCEDQCSKMEWRQRSAYLWPTVLECLTELRELNDLVVIEGAGSPAEINLQASDLVNMRVAEAAQASTLLICDIDRGGAFAHLYGTYHLLPPEHRRLIRGFVLNKFRGDASLLAPGPENLEALTGVPTIGVLPMWREHGLPEEDGVFDTVPGAKGLSIVIVAYPRISNLDEFAPLRQLPDTSVTWARRPETLAQADLLILPGSKHVAEDLEWLRSTGLAAAIERHVRADRPTLAVCGGLQMLGAHIHDPHGVEGAATGLGLLPLASEFEREKRYQRGRYRFGQLHGFWGPLSDVAFDGYEIRHGRSRLHSSEADLPTVALPDDCGWQSRQLLALYTHGLFESAHVMRALFGVRVPTLEDTFEALGDFVLRHVGESTLMALIAASGAK